MLYPYGNFYTSAYSAEWFDTLVICSKDTFHVRGDLWGPRMTFRLTAFLYMPSFIVIYYIKKILLTLKLLKKHVCCETCQAGLHAGPHHPFKWSPPCISWLGFYSRIDPYTQFAGGPILYWG